MCVSVVSQASRLVHCQHQLRALSGPARRFSGSLVTQMEDSVSARLIGASGQPNLSGPTLAESAPRAYPELWRDKKSCLETVCRC